MRKVSVYVCLGWLLLILAGCGKGPGVSSNDPTPNSVPVSLTITDDPPSGVDVLAFQISLSAASLIPASGSGAVSLLNNNTPAQIDVMQLQTLSAFLGAANVPPGTYNSLSLTFANPQLVIFNASDQTIASACPLNTVCSLTPQLDNSSSITFSSPPFPVAVAQQTPLSLLIDFHLNNVIQNDLSVNLGVANGLTISQLPSLPAPPPVGPPVFGFLSGTVKSVDSSQSQFTLQNAVGGTFIVDVNSNTMYENFPGDVCSTSGFSCVATGQSVQVEVASVENDGAIVAAEVSYLQAAGQQTLVGGILSVSSANGSTVLKLLLQSSPDGSPLPSVGDVTVLSTAAFSIDADSFTIPSGFSFTGPSDLVLGQEVTVDVVSGTLSPPTTGGSGPPSFSFNTDQVTLEAGQLTSTVTAITSGSSTFAIVGPGYYLPSGCSTCTPITVETTSQTTYQGLTPDSFSGLTVNGVVSVQGWLFPTPTGATPSTMVAQTVIGRSGSGY